MLHSSTEMTAEQHMPSVLDPRRALQIYPAILGLCAKMIWWSSPFHSLQATILLPICLSALGPESNEHVELRGMSIQVRFLYSKGCLHSRMASGADPDILGPVSQIQDSRILDDPGIFGSKMAVLAFTSSLVRTLNLVKVVSSAPSRARAARAWQYILEYCEIWSVMRMMAVRDRVQVPLEGAERITCEY